jgi:hypothetical protein
MNTDEHGFLDSLTAHILAPCSRYPTLWARVSWRLHVGELWPAGGFHLELPQAVKDVAALATKWIFWWPAAPPCPERRYYNLTANASDFDISPSDLPSCARCGLAAIPGTRAQWCLCRAVGGGVAETRDRSGVETGRWPGFQRPCSGARAGHTVPSARKSGDRGSARCEHWEAHLVGRLSNRLSR